MSDFIAYAKSHDGVRFFDCATFAQWCVEHTENLEDFSYV